MAHVRSGLSRTPHQEIKKKKLRTCYLFMFTLCITVIRENLEKQRTASEEERKRLVGLVSQLEQKLAEQRQSAEEERWNLRQEAARLDAATKALEKERERAMQQIDVEQQQLQASNSLWTFIGYCLV
jgi:hypothetical protein